MATADKTQQRFSEFLGLFTLAVSVLLLISLASYNPADPAPFFKAGAGGHARNWIGPTGAFIAELLIPQLFGLAAMVLPVVFAVWGWKLFWCRPVEAPYTKAAGLGLLMLMLTAFLTLAIGTVSFEADNVRAGGATGQLLSDWLTERFNRPGAYIIVLTLLIVSVILTTQFSFAAFLRGAWALVQGRVRALMTAWAHYRETRRKENLRQDVVRKHTLRRQEEAPAENPRGRAQQAAAVLDEDLVAAEAEAPKPAPAQPRIRASAPLAPTSPAPPAPQPRARPDRDFAAEAEPEAPKPKRRARGEVAGGIAADGPLPPTSLLDAIVSEGRMDKDRLFERARTLESKSAEFDVHGSVVEIHPGPVVTTYEFKPDAGVKYSKIVGLADDLSLALEAEALRIDRMSGRGTVGVEIPNETREIISLREILESDAFRKSPGRLTLALGKTVGGETCVSDLAAMPHLLIAGSTGTGKSVGLNCMIASILFKCTPDECRLILIDPKRLELGVYEDIPHLLTPVVTDPKIAANVLKWAVTEMEKRIRMLAGEGVRNIDQFNNIVRNEKAQSGSEDLKPLHYIVIIIDELADLMMVSAREVEESITRLAQMARAVGIHLILATQRPSVDVITGLIKANFPSRISFRVAARVDSRTILDSIGAERLLGRGDMLFLPPGSARLMRIHGAFVTEVEIARLTQCLRGMGKPSYDDTVGKTEQAAAERAAANDDKDELFDEAVRFVVTSGQASTSMLQRRFRIGFSRAGRLVDIMERDGIIGPADGSKAREILVAADYYETVDAWPK